MISASGPPFLHVSGSADPTADRARLAAAHAFVAALVQLGLTAGAGFTLFLGPEPVSANDPALPIVFDGTVLRAAAAWAGANVGSRRPLLRVVTAPKHLERSAPRASVETLRRLRELGLAEIRSIPDDAFTGETLRKAVLDNSEAVVAVSGGKGVRSLVGPALARGIPFLPLAIDLGSSLTDGRGAPDLYAEFARTPERFLPASRPAIAGIETDLSLTSPLGGPWDAARTALSLIDAELTLAAQPGSFALVVTVLPVELRAAAAVLGIDVDREPDLVPDGTAVWRGAVEGPSGPRGVALTCLGAAGNVNAAAVLTGLLHAVSPRLVVVSGIAAGRRGKRRLGDCVVAERVVAYEGAADKDSGTARRPSMPEVSHHLRQFLAAHLAHGELPNRLAARFGEAGGIWPSHPDGASGPSLHLATVAAGEKLLRRAGFWDELAELHEKVEAAEMEGHGLAVAASLSNVPWLLVRGISDFGDAEKNDVFHEAAALAAGCAAADLVSRCWESISPRTTP